MPARSAPGIWLGAIDAARRCSSHGHHVNALVIFVLGLAISACQAPKKTGPEQAEGGQNPATEASSVPTLSDLPAPSETELARSYAAAETELARVSALPALPGAAGFERIRTQLVARAKSEPVIFTQTPEYSRDRNPEVINGRKLVAEARPAWRALLRLRKKYEHREDILRKILLRDGYLYSESPDMAFAMISQVRPRELFRDPEIWLQRGSATLHALMHPKFGYVYTDGPEAGTRVQLLHLDRVGNGPAPDAALHRDIRALRYKLLFEEIRIRRITNDFLVADCRYGKVWIPTVLHSTGPRLTLNIELVTPEQVPLVAAARAELRSKWFALNQLQDAMRAQIDEALPFDEPKTEIGQEDGKLRRAWVTAYSEGALTYSYNDDEYPVFDRKGRPRVPQVCIDFVLDTFERAAGSWWLPQSSGIRTRTAGAFRFSSLKEPGTSLRQTGSFVRLAEAHPELFDVLHFPERSQIELGYKERLFRWLEKHVDDFEVGDVILIRGPTPWDDAEEHTHAFFIYEVDPITRVPIAIAGNAGPANLWSWETEARRTPHRTIRTRIRPNAAWLTTLFSGTAEPPQAPTLVSGFR